MILHMCMFHSNGIDVFQSAGGAALTTKVAKTKVAGGTKVRWLREVALVSKTHIL